MQVGCIHSVQMSCKSCKIMLFMTVLDIEPCLFVCLFLGQVIIEKWVPFTQ